MLLPWENRRLRSSLRRRRPLRRLSSVEYLHRDIESTLCSFFEMEIKLAQQINQLKQELDLTYDFTIAKAFRTIDAYGKGFINKKVLK